MLLRATLKALAFLLNGAVFVVGLARLQGRLAPPDYMYVGLLFTAPLVSSFALALGFRRRADPEVRATANAAAFILNGVLLVFVAWLTTHLDPETRTDEGLWLVMLFLAPALNAAALVSRRE